MNQLLKQFSNRRILAIFLLSFSSGLPIALTSSTLQAWYTESGVSLTLIGMLTLTKIPYLYKFFWAPILDRFVPFKLGRRRSWVLLMQVLLACTLIVMAFLNPKHAPYFLASMALMLAFFSATQDIGIDAYRADVLHAKERGMGSAMTSYGYRVAMVASGAVALIFAAKIGWRLTYLLMAALMAVEIVVTLWSPNPDDELAGPRTLKAAVVEPFKEFISRKNAVMILVFIATYKLGEAFALALNTTFLLRGVGFSLIDVGSISKVLGMAGGLLGCMVGGIFLPKLGLYRSLFYFGFLSLVANLLFALLAVVGKNYTLMSLAVFSDYFCGALSGVAFVSFLMGLCNVRYSATQYALFSALMQIGQVIAGPEAALMVSHMGWAKFYVWTFFVGVPSLWILWWLNNGRVNFTAERLGET